MGVGPTRLSGSLVGVVSPGGPLPGALRGARRGRQCAHIWLNKPRIAFSRTLGHVEWDSGRSRKTPPGNCEAESQPGRELFLPRGMLAPAVIPLVTLSVKFG